MNLTLRRLRQVTAAIKLRGWQKDIRERRLVAWHARTISSFVAATLDTGGGENPLIPALQKIALDPLESADLEEASSAPVPVEPRQGSYERMVSGLGGSPHG